MAEVKPFKVATKRYEMTETEVIRLRSKLFKLRKQYVQQLWSPQLSLDAADIQKLESKINSLEHKLAHAVITG